MLVERTLWHSNCKDVDNNHDQTFNTPYNGFLAISYETCILVYTVYVAVTDRKQNIIYSVI